jgi:hypothetical protein
VTRGWDLLVKWTAMADCLVCLYPTSWEKGVGGKEGSMTLIDKEVDS